MYYENIILGAGPSALQLGYYFKKSQIPYLIIEKQSTCASFFNKYPVSDKLISLNKKYTGETNSDFNLRHDWNSLLNDEGFLFTDYSDELYPSASHLHQYLNDFAVKFDLNIDFNKTINEVVKCGAEYHLITSCETLYMCKKLIVATGLSKPNIPKNISFHPSDLKVKHYADFKKEFFANKDNLNNYINKKVLIIGGGNAGYEIANILDKYCSSVIVLGSNKKLSIVSHYVGDIRSIYLPFYDSFYLKSLNGIDALDRNQFLSIKYENNKYGFYSGTNAFYKQKLTHFDDIIFCTGWTFDNSIFKFDIKTVINNKYPEIKENYESSNNENLFFIGSLMHSHDYRKGSGGFIHGFRYLLKLFIQVNYGVPKVIHNFKFTGNMDCYEELAKHIFKRINYASSLYQLYGTMCDIFYFDKSTNNIIYIEDWTKYCIKHLTIPNGTYINYLQLEYGNEETIISRLGRFDKWNPNFLHPRIYMAYYENNFIKPLDRVVFEEDLIADFSSNEHYNKIVQVLKMCNLII